MKYCQIVKIEEISYDGYEYDIQVEDNENFYADDILVHNCKLDGARCHMSLQAGRAVAFSRNGKPIELHGVFDNAIKELVSEGETLDGELLAMRDGKILDRKTGNGIVNSLINITDKRQKLEDKICQLEQKLKELSMTQ